MVGFLIKISLIRSSGVEEKSFGNRFFKYLIYIDLLRFDMSKRNRK